ncbi:DUF1592 domain-containing protein [Paludisphaera mucosa]|uniref:DUF1592 domain-containing protein n=1 Tax=Paludisphaera mucosa TaxID=3030827 RepID=A0ABT6FL07_9BACT|nr:DUF1592 domain-containing protein [Paludisphaera mucosa]MDG3008251.1 DUF1592 domain-containing protein [Paludisphaera mucosa]
MSRPTTFRGLRSLGFVVLLAFAPAATTWAAPPDSFESLAREYGGQVRPMLAKFCLDCHSTEDKEGDLDLEAFARLDDVRHAPATWQKVAEMLDNGEMPPKESPKPEPAERAAIRGWVGRYLRAEAFADAGDPGPVVLRRLNNAQYTYTLRDLTGFDFQPAREFPADSAAGEGFTNTGDALVMSPALLGKYLDAAKKVAAHAVLLPDGMRFAPGETRRDWAEELLVAIRSLYARHADGEGKIAFDKYLTAGLEERDAIAAGRETYDSVAQRRGLNARYLKALAGVLAGGEPSPVLDPLRARWKAAKPGDVPALLAEITAWQAALTKFQTVGHMKSWVAAIDPVVARQDLRFKLPDVGDAREVVVNLAAGGVERSSVVVWENLRIARAGRPDVAIRDLRAIAEGMAARREQVVASAAKCLEAAAEALAAPATADRDALARKHEVDPEILGAWLACLGIGPNAPTKLELFTERMQDVGGFDFVKGWGSSETPLAVANASKETVHIPGELKGRGVAVHPSPTLRAGAGWACPVAGEYRINAQIQHVHPACGNGTTWRLELRRGAVRIALADGVAVGPTPAKAGPFGPIALNPGDLIALAVSPRDGNHSCDLTAVDLTVTAAGEGGRKWDLAADVSGDAMAANPHADGFGNAAVWSFFREPDADSGGLALPAGSLLARWLATPEPTERAAIAGRLQKLLASGPAGAAAADVALYRGLTTPGGPIIPAQPSGGPIPADSTWGLDPATFGPTAVAAGIGVGDLAVRSPSTVAIRIPAELAAGAELMGSAVARPVEGGDDFVQLRITTGAPANVPGLRPDAPVLVVPGGTAETRLKAAFAEFRAWFPPAVCYEKIVPVDEVVTLTLFHREDEPLRRLLLDDAEAARLDRLWVELHFVTQDALTQVGAFNQLMEYATQDSDPRLFEPFRKPIHERAEAFRKELIAAEPRQLDALIAFASQAYRRPTTDREAQELRELYARLRAEELPHDEAFRLTLARILMAPNFLYRLEKAPVGVKSASASDWELASRLSYFLTSSAPDAALREAAAAGKLRDPDVLAAQAKRLMQSPDVRRLAEEFACQWLHIYDFDTLDEKSERHFPTFAALKGAMYEEAILFFADLFRNDAPVLSIYDADHTFLNQALAEHYQIPGVTGPEWRRVDGVRKHGRGGILGLAATLAQQSGASRTSPILRGNWVTEVLLGERTPKPPKNVPILPDDEASGGGLSVRQLVEKHTKDIRCAGCHAKMDPYGFSLEAYDAIGRFRDKDAAGQPIDAHAKLPDGSEVDGGDGLRSHLLTKRREAVERQFCKKLLGYALGRGLMLTDEPLLDEMRLRLESEGHRVSSAVDAIVRSRQFREVRGASPVLAEAR